MARASSAPATKLDIRVLKQDLRDEIKTSEKEVIRQFKFIAEQIHKDAVDANKERIEMHEDRIKRIEKHVGLSHSLSV